MCTRLISCTTNLGQIPDPQDVGGGGESKLEVNALYLPHLTSPCLPFLLPNNQAGSHQP